ncbi:MAG: glycosyl hydrolase [Mangrovibacterium sp.]
MKNHLHHLLLLFLLFAQCSSDDNATEKNGNNGLTQPRIMSSSPADQSVVDYCATKSVSITFNAAIQIISSSDIKLNDTAVSAVSAENETLTISLGTLKANTDYTLSIAALAIKVKAGAVNSETLYIDFSTSKETTQEINISTKLAMSKPTAEASALYQYLYDNYGENCISSSMANVNWNINEALWVEHHTGKRPVIATFDYVHLYASPANWIDYTNTSIPEEWASNGGIISAGWHWNVPKNKAAYESGDVNQLAFYTEGNEFSVSRALTDGTWENEVLQADLKKMGDMLQLLKEKNIALLWRPLHEAAGNIYEFSGGTAWFWWGAEGGTAYVQLWQYVFNYFQERELNNLIWVWTTQMNDEEFYPGDDYVDIIGRDIYNNTDLNDIASQFNDIQNTYYSKMVALSECGNVADMAKQWEAGARWSYFMPWYDYERTNNTSSSEFSLTSHEFANIGWWKKSEASNHIIMK